jgi:type III secretion protein HrpB1
MPAKPEYLNCSADVVGGLIEAVSTALFGKLRDVHTDAGDIEAMLEALHVLRPAVAEIDTLDALQHMMLGDWDVANRVLREVIEKVPRFAYAKVLLALCLSAQKDPDWKIAAAQALEASPDRATRRLVATLDARADLIKAMRHGAQTGDFVVPPSIEKLKEFDLPDFNEQDAPASRADTAAPSASAARRRAAPRRAAARPSAAGGGSSEPMPGGGYPRA